MNIWECPNDTNRRRAFCRAKLARCLAAILLAIDWHGPEKSAVAEEAGVRSRTAGNDRLLFAGRHDDRFRFAAESGRSWTGAIGWRSATCGLPIPRAQEVADKTKGETIYIRPDGVGKPGETRNWDAKMRDPRCVNCRGRNSAPRSATSATPAGDFDRPDNPKEARYSNAIMGRFGLYFEYNLTKEKPPLIHYPFGWSAAWRPKTDRRDGRRFRRPVQAKEI